MAGRSCCRPRCRCWSDDTVETLSARILVEEHRLYPEAIRLVLEGGWTLRRSPLRAARSVHDVRGREDDSTTYRAIARGRRAAARGDDGGAGCRGAVRRRSSRSRSSSSDRERAARGRPADPLSTRVVDGAGRLGVDAPDGDARLAAYRRPRTGRRRSSSPTLDWWDRMFGVDLIVSSLALHHLNDAKKQYLYKAAAERMSPRGALLIADLRRAAASSRARTLAADRWDALARRQAEAARRAGAVSAVPRRALEPFPVSRRDGPAVGADAPSGVAAPRRVCRGR